jgi:hypothetical protein
VAKTEYLRRSLLVADELEQLYQVELRREVN